MDKVSWIFEMVTVRCWPVILPELMWNDPWHMKVIITFTFCCDNLWKSIVFGSGKSPENSQNFFFYFVVTLWWWRRWCIHLINRGRSCLALRRRWVWHSWCVRTKVFWSSASTWKCAAHASTSTSICSETTTTVRDFTAAFLALCCCGILESFCCHTDTIVWRQEGRLSELFCVVLSDYRLYRLSS